MSKHIILASLLALAVGSNVVLAAEKTAEQPANKEATATEPVTVLYKDNPEITSYMRTKP